MSLLGDQVVELFLWHHTVTISVCALDHLLKDWIVSQLSEVLGHFSQVLQSDVSWMFKFLPVLLGSKVMKTLWTSSLDSFSEGLVVIISKNSWNSICPLPSLSISAIIWYTAWAWASIPRELIATLSSTYVKNYPWGRPRLRDLCQKDRKPS